MSPTATHPAPSALREQPATQACRKVEDLLADLRIGAWTPTALEQRVATLLTLSAAGAGCLTSGHVRSALWEGAVAMTQENGARFATALAAFVRVLDAPEPGVPGLADAVAGLVAAVAAHR